MSHLYYRYPKKGKGTNAKTYIHRQETPLYRSRMSHLSNDSSRAPKNE